VQVVVCKLPAEDVNDAMDADPGVFLGIASMMSHSANNTFHVAAISKPVVELPYLART
jgi:hypothetical protein